MPGQVQELLYRIVWDDGDASKKRDAWNRSFASSQKQANLLSKAFLEIGKALGSFTIDAVRNFAQFEDTLSHARRTMGLSRDETLQLGDALMDLSTNFELSGLRAGISANELAKISGILGQLGFNIRDNADQFLHLTEVVAKVGTAFGMSSAKAAEGLGILRNLYDLPIEKLENAASSIAYLGNTTVATAGQIMDIMQRMGGIAGLLGVSAQEAAALAATLRESGVRAQVAGTAMSQIFSRLASDVDRFGEVLKKGGISSEMLRMKIESGDATGALKDVLQALQNIQGMEGKIAATQALKDLGLSGVRVQQALLALSNNIGGLNENLAKSEEAFRENKAVNNAYAAAIDNTAKKWAQFQNLLDIITKLIGKDLAIAFGDFLDNHLLPFIWKFEEWLKTSEGAKAIFGKEGFIAQGLEWIGQKLTENEETFFDWIDNIDQEIPKIIEELKKEFKTLWEPVLEYLKEVYEQLKGLGPIIEDVGAAWKAIHGFIEAARDALEPLRPLLDPIWDISIKISDAMLKMAEFSANLVEIFAKLGSLILEKISPAIAKISEKMSPIIDKVYGGIKQGAGEVIDKMDELIGKTQEATDAMQDYGDVAEYKSVLPDIAKGTALVTAKTEELTQVYAGMHSRLDDIYQTGENTFSNLTRDVETYHEAFRNSGWKANTEVQYYLTQTGEAVGQLGLAYQSMGKDAETATTKILETTQAIDALQKAHETNQAIVAGHMGSSQNMTAAQWAGLSSGQIGTLLNQPGLFTASGISQGLSQQRAKAGQELQQEAQQQFPAEVTLVMGDQEIGRLTAVVNDRNQQEQRRSFGANTNFMRPY